MTGRTPLPDVDLDDLPDGLLVADADGLVVAVNAAARSLLGLGDEDLTGRPAREVAPLGDPELGDWWLCVNPYQGLSIRTGTPERLLTLCSGPAAGTRLLVTARFVRNHRAAGTDRAVSRVVLAMRSARSRDLLDRARAELVSAAAHELRSPLAGVKGFSRTLVTRWDRFSDEDRRQMLGIIDAAVDRATRLIEELLDVSRLELGTLSVRPEYVDLAEVATRVVQGRVASGESEERFAVDVVDEVPLQWLDRLRMTQVVDNLVDNALRHGEGRVTIRLGTLTAPPEEMRTGTVTESYVLIEVTDQGHGVAPEVRPRVFRKFWRTDRGGGTGLGLFFVKGIAEAHGGAVSVDTGPDGGARFRVCVPSVPPPEPPTAES